MTEDNDAFTQEFRSFIYSSFGREDNGLYQASTCLCFAAQIIIDIRDLMGDQFNKTHRLFEDKLTTAADCLRGESTTSSDDWMQTRPAQAVITTVIGSATLSFKEYREQITKEMKDVNEDLISKF